MSSTTSFTISAGFAASMICMVLLSCGTGAAKTSTTTTLVEQSPLWELSEIEHERVFGIFTPSNGPYLQLDKYYFFFGDHTFVTNVSDWGEKDTFKYQMAIGEWRLRDSKYIDIRLRSVLVGTGQSEAQKRNQAAGIAGTAFNTFVAEPVPESELTAWYELGNIVAEGEKTEQVKIKLKVIMNTGLERRFSRGENIVFKKTIYNSTDIRLLNLLPKSIGNTDYEQMMKISRLERGHLF